MRNLLPLLTATLVCLSIANESAQAADNAKIILVAGRPSHGPGDHEFNAGCKLMAKCLGDLPGVEPVFVAGGWPKDESVFEGARAVVFFMDGGGGHPMIQKDHLETIQKLMDKGVGLACLHYAVEVPKGKPGDKFLDWLGGYYETGFSTNPHWVAELKSMPDHPITRGVKPFSIKDEWYFNIRFRPEMKGITPILSAKPDDQTRQGVSSSPRGPYTHILEAKGRDEVLAWCVERSDGGRGFGFTGAHAHKNWGEPNFRKLVLNAVLWTAKLDVPNEGVECNISNDDLKQNLDDKR
ncbi:MAG TPA: ThuA domain-containing protein [Chloroflexota bacterium]|nr:ThuA domain-containing protein [Chloroflexota bacterium]